MSRGSIDLAARAQKRRRRAAGGTYHPVVAVLGVGVAPRRGSLHGLEPGATHDGAAGSGEVNGGVLLAVEGGALQRRERREMPAGRRRRRHGGDHVLAGVGGVLRHGSSDRRGMAATAPEQEVLATERGGLEEEVLSVIAMVVTSAGMGGLVVWSWGRREQGHI